MRVSLPKTGFLPGQNAHIKIFVTNPTTVEIQEISVRLLKRIHYHADQPYENYFEDSVDIDSVVRKERFKNKDVECEIPFVIPDTVTTSRKNNSKILNVFYEFEIEAKVLGECPLIPSYSIEFLYFQLPSFHNDLRIKIPIVIGNMPFEDEVQGTSEIPHVHGRRPTILQFYSSH